MDQGESKRYTVCGLMVLIRNTIITIIIFLSIIFIITQLGVPIYPIFLPELLWLIGAIFAFTQMALE